LPLVQLNSCVDTELLPRTFVLSLGVTFFYLLQRRVQFVPNREQRMILISSALVLLTTTLSLFQSLNKGEALSELLRLFVLYSLLYISMNVFSRSKTEPIFIARFASLALVILHCFALVQLFNVSDEYLKTHHINLFSRIVSTLSNKNFFSEVMVILLPLPIFGFLYDERKFRFLHLFIVLLNLFFILILYSVSAWFAIAFSTLFITGFYFLYGKKSKASPSNSRFILPGVMIVFFLLFFFIINPVRSHLTEKISAAKEYWKNPDQLNKNLQENNNSVFDRILLARNSFRMIKSHPVLGVGLNNWKLLFPAYGVGGTEVINTGAMNFEHPHNDYLLIFSEQGLLGITAYLVFFLLTFLFLLRKYKSADDAERRFLLVLLFILIAFFCLSLFSYPRSRIYSPALLLFFIGYLFSSTDKQKDSKWVIKSELNTILLFISIAALAISFIRVKSDMAYKEMLIYKVKGNFPGLIIASEKVNETFSPVDIATTSAQWYLGMANFYSGNLKQALEHYQAAAVITPNHLRTLNDLATCYEQNGLPDSALFYYSRALLIAPAFNEARLNRVATYFNRGQLNDALKDIQQINVHQPEREKSETYVKFMDAILYAKLDDTIAVNKNPELMEFYYALKRDRYTFNMFIRKYSGTDIWTDLFVRNK
jgi:O-antigen ligase